jgi:predicted NBD/HSP70 family sugar kinase
VNTAVVLRALAARNGDVTAKNLIEATGLSRRTVDLIVSELVAGGWVRDAPSESGGGAGRPARRFRFVADHRVVAAARIDTHHAHGAVADLRGRILGRTSLRLADYHDPARAVADAAASVRAAASEAEVPLERLCAGGVAAGGVIDPAGLVHRLVSAPDWAGFALAEAFATEFGLPWVADNDANLAALAEHRAGAAQGRRDIAWVIHGHRTGVGLIVNREVHRGASGGAGELIESRVLDLDRSAKHPIGMLSSPVASAREEAARLVEAARRGDADALGLAEEFAASLVEVIDVIAWTIAPELIVLGGGLELGADVLIPLIQARLREVGTIEVELAATAIGADAPLVGALRYALDRIDAELYGPVVA